MNPQRRAINLFRLLFAITSALIGWMIGAEFLSSPWTGTAIGLIVGLLVILADRLLKGISLRLFSAATFGLLLGLLLARLLIASEILRYLDPDKQWMIGIAVYATAGYLGMMLAIRSNRDEFALIIPFVRFQQSGGPSGPVVLDTSAIIDGRIEAVCKTGFLTGTLVIPRIVLEELQTLADSSDPTKREKGKRGLATLEGLRSNADLGFTIHESGDPSPNPVDTQIVVIAKSLGARVVSNDANLRRIAAIQNVTALNLNDLAAALRPTVAIGDSIRVSLVKEGRDPSQAVGYLDDGSMVVVNHASQRIGHTEDVTVISIVQTSAGRMLFGELQSGSPHPPA